VKKNYKNLNKPRLEAYASYSEFIRRTALLEANGIVCNEQNNLVDKAWFGKENIFNSSGFKHGQ
jgi:hypothetical protein